MGQPLVEIVRNAHISKVEQRRLAAIDVASIFGDGYNVQYLEYLVYDQPSVDENWIKMSDRTPTVGQVITFAERGTDRSENTWRRMAGNYFVLVDRATKWTKYQLFQFNTYLSTTSVPRTEPTNDQASIPAYRYLNFTATCKAVQGGAWSTSEEIYLKLPDLFGRPDRRTSYPMLTPTTFTVTAQVDGHKVAISSADGSMLYPGFYYWEVEQADNGSGLNAVSLIYGPTDLPALVDIAPGVTKYYRVRSVSTLGDVSAWTAYTSAVYSGVPAQPTWVSHIYQETGHMVAWSHPTPVTVSYFTLYRNTSASLTGATVVASISRNGTSWLIPYDPSLGTYFGLKAVGYTGADNGAVWIGPYLPFLISIQDRFDGYGGSSFSPLNSLWWLGWDSMESSAGYLAFMYTDVTPLHSVYGANSFKMYPDHTDLGSSVYWKQNINLESEGRFNDDDYLCLYLYAENLSSSGSFEIEINIASTPTDALCTYKKTISALGNNFIRWKRSEYDSMQGGFDWATVIGYIIVSYGLGPTDQVFYIDDLRIVKADPADAATYNDTGNAWDKAASTGSDVGEWHIYAGNRTGEPSKPFSYGQIKTGAAVWYLSYKPLATTSIITGTVQAGIFLRESAAKAGLAFYVQDVTAGSWDMYAVEVDSSAQPLKLVKWVAGVRTEIGSAAFAGAAGKILWVGVDFREFNSDGGRLKVFASLTEGNVIQAANLKISVQDISLTAGGSVGVLSYQANARFVDFTAGSPAHAEVADLAKMLDGPVIDGVDGTARVFLAVSPVDGRLMYSKDQKTWLSSGSISGAMEVNESGQLLMFKLPTSDPGVPNVVWQDGVTLKISAGAGVVGTATGLIGPPTQTI